MSQDFTPLALDDLVHIMSPSPAPQTLADDSDTSLRRKSPSPEPVQDSDVLRMRKQITDMRILDKGQMQSNLRERELAEMVLRLTNAPKPHSDQLFRQAEMISALTQQRDLLIHQAEEQRLRWNSEKDGWARMSEALLAQQAKNRTMSDKDEDAERTSATVEADNKSLRQRLHETQSRMQTLEAELGRLRPLLLMQPVASTSSLLTPQPKQHHHSRRRKKDVIPSHVATEDEAQDASDEDVSRLPPARLDPQTTPTQSQSVQMTPKTKSRRSELTNSIYAQSNLLHHHKRRSSLKHTTRGLSADARTEHLLLAARKIGKQRAGILSGMMQQLEERERGRRREDSAATVVATATTPKTPRRTAQHPGYPPEGGGYVYLKSPVRPGPGMHPVPVLIPAYPHLLHTPSSTTSSSAQQSAQKQDVRTQNPPTPLDSLLSAARSMMHHGDDDDDDAGEPSTAAGTRRTRSSDLPESPVPKRRRVATRAAKGATSKDLSSSTNATPAATKAGVGRVKSALDVLADQAAAFSSQDPALPQTQSQDKGKGKERADTSDISVTASKGKERGRSHRKSSEVNTSLSAVPRSGTPQLELESEPLATSSRTSQPLNGGAASETPGDPGGTGGHVAVASSPHGADAASGQEDQVMCAPDGACTSHSPQTPTTHHGEVADLDITPTQTQSSSDRPKPDSRGQSEVITTQLPIPEAEPTPVPVPQCVTSIAASTSPEEHLTNSQRHQQSETAPAVTLSWSENGAPSKRSAAPARNKDHARVAGQDAPAGKRQRSPYVKWSKEEDDLLAQAVAKYGQKWDLVQKALPSRGYHQVRQRWLRKLGVFDTKPDLSSFQTISYPPASRLTGESIAPSSTPPVSEPPPNPKLGLAPLSSELAFSSLTGRGGSRPPS